MMPRSERETRLAEAWPAAVADYLSRLSHEHLRPAFLQVDADGNVTSAGGALEVYGLSAVQAGTPVIDYLPLLMGLLPTYEAVGAWAPVLLVVMRFVQGLGVGGEWAGAVLLVVEHGGSRGRGDCVNA